MRTTRNPLDTVPEVLASVHNVTKLFNGARVLNDVSLNISAGETIGLLGPNGAGKSTLINLLTGLRRPDSGTVRLFGRNPLDPTSRLRLGITPQATSVPFTLKVREAAEFVAAHYPAPIPVPELLEDFGLAELANRQCGGLSGGQQRRLLVALALVGRPDLLILDEPTVGLDLDARAMLWHRLREYHAAGGTLLITSHYLEEIQALTGRVVVIDSGSVIADDTVEQIRHRVGLSRMSFRTLEPISSFTTLQDTVRVEITGDGRLTLITRDADHTVRHLINKDMQFTDLEIHRASLEEAFKHLTTTSPGGVSKESRTSAS